MVRLVRTATVQVKFQWNIFLLIHEFNNMKQKFEMQLSNSQQLQLICNCCGQPYYPDKSWQDKLAAVYYGTERYAICPVCTQAPPQDIFHSMAYRKRCLREVVRLELLYKASQKKN